MNRTSIEWCRTYNEDGTYTEGYSVNPVRFRPFGSDRLTTMCQRCSPGCAACYAESIVKRFWPKSADTLFPGYTAQGITAGEVVLDDKQLLSVLKHRKPCKIFWGDMTDLFGDWVPFEMLDKCLTVCALTPHITHMFLTKRPERMLAYMKDMRSEGWTSGYVALGFGRPARFLPFAFKELPLNNYEQMPWPLPNVWVGTSCENQKYADERIPLICQVPAKVHFISAEPLLGPIDLEWPETIYPDGPPRCCSGLPNECGCMGMPTDPPLCYGLQLCIVGGESGPKARPMEPEWAISLRDQCKRWNVSFFMKQMGSVYGANKGKELPKALAIQEFPEVRA